MDDELILPNIDLMRKHSDLTYGLTQPLREQGVVMFSHTKVFHDNTFIDLSDRIDMLDNFYFQTDNYKYYTPDTKPWDITQDYFLCSTLVDNPSIIDLRDNLHIDNIIVLIDRHATHYDLWHFGGKTGDPNIVNFFINHLQWLKTFTVYFKAKANHIIQEACDNRIIRPPDLYPEPAPLNHFNPTDFNSLFSNDFCLEYQGRLIQLSKRELNIIGACLNGLSSMQIAKQFYISKRTVEKHISNVKKKFQCNKTIDILRILSENNLLSILKDYPLSE